MAEKGRVAAQPTFASFPTHTLLFRAVYVFFFLQLFKQDFIGGVVRVINKSIPQLLRASCRGGGGGGCEEQPGRVIRNLTSVGPLSPPSGRAPRDTQPVCKTDDNSDFI